MVFAASDQTIDLLNYGFANPGTQVKTNFKWRRNRPCIIYGWKTRLVSTVVKDRLYISPGNNYSIRLLRCVFSITRKNIFHYVDCEARREPYSKQGRNVVQALVETTKSYSWKKVDCALMNLTTEWMDCICVSVRSVWTAWHGKKATSSILELSCPIEDGELYAGQRTYSQTTCASERNARQVKGADWFDEYGKFQWTEWRFLGNERRQWMG